jgi:hypothetical protein
MRDHAPAVYEWLARMWNAGTRDDLGAWPLEWPGGLAPILDEIGRCYLPYLEANAAAHAQGQKRVRWSCEGTAYDTPVHAYRVQCLQTLKTVFGELEADGRAEVLRLCPGAAGLNDQ